MKVEPRQKLGYTPDPREGLEAFEVAQTRPAEGTRGQQDRQFHALPTTLLDDGANIHHASSYSTYDTT